VHSAGVETAIPCGTARRPMILCFRKA